MTAQASGISGYQWLDCATQNPISGAVGQQFMPTVSGSYAVVLTDGACVDTSACTNVVIVGLGQPFGAAISLYPNPTSGQLKVDFGQVIDGATLSVQNALGQEVARLYVRDVRVARVDVPGSAGVYGVRVRVGDAWQTIKVVKR